MILVFTPIFLPWRPVRFCCLESGLQFCGADPVDVHIAYSIPRIWSKYVVYLQIAS